MLLEAVYHRPKQTWSFAYDPETIHLRLRAKKDDLTEVFALVGDKYAWEATSELVPMKIFTSDGMFDYWECAVRPPYRRLTYGFLLRKDSEEIWMTEDDFLATRPENQKRLFEFPFLNAVDIFSPPEWAKDAIFYQIFPERFANGDTSNDPEGTEPWGGKPERGNFFGGDLQGVIDHLDHIAGLGVNAIYFTPIFQATTNHKYDTEDYMQVDPQFGDAETVKKLVAACHSRGIRVVLDAVFNHSGRTFGPFVDVLKNGAASRYKDWFHVRKFPIAVDGDYAGYDTFAFEPMMPKLNTENPEVKDYLLNVARYWIEEIGIDGWRLDVANEVDHSFWRDFRKTVKAANPEAYILGEIWHESSPWLAGDQFDAVMNYPFTEAVLDFFVRERTDAEQFANAIGKQLSRYPLQASEVTFNLLDSHDTPRLLTHCNGDKKKMKLTAIVQFTFMGAPCIYYGDEVGMEGGDDPDCRKCMEWNPAKQDKDLHAFYRKLISVRKANPELRRGAITFLEAEPGEARLAYERNHEGDKTVVLLNSSMIEQNFRLPVTESHWLDLWTGKSVSAAGGNLEINLPPLGFALLKTSIKGK
ncbi:alpha-glycosidase [Gorillibacterium massiliense]|uniref:alpha-glycosidase n=1 Tax=Gorillibacterium massiliense TaxID=1280390 RepID=UPI0004AFAECE|nr:alpha-glycosidase [Gorillibacterium massiliense]